MTVTSDTTYHPGHCPDGTGTCFNETDPEHQLLENVGNRLNWSDPTCSAMYNNLFSQLEWGGIDEWTVDNGMGGYWISGFHGYDSNGKRYDAISLPYFAVNAQYIGSWNTAHALFHEAAHSYWNNDNDEIAEDWANQCIFKP